jgi:hypothetical protein
MAASRQAASAFLRFRDQVSENGGAAPTHGSVGRKPVNPVASLALAFVACSTLLLSSPARAEDASRPEEAPVVELSADDGRATLERRTSTTSPSGMPLVETGLFSVGQWEHACIAPCQVRLDPRYAYRVGGDGLVPTGSFGLPRGADTVRVDAQMGGSVARGTGAVAMGLGVASVVLGGLALAASPVLESEEVGSQGFRTAVLVGGVSAATVGVVSAGVGLFLWLTNGSSARTEIALRAR